MPFPYLGKPIPLSYSHSYWPFLSTCSCKLHSNCIVISNCFNYIWLCFFLFQVVMRGGYMNKHLFLLSSHHKPKEREKVVASKLWQIVKTGIFDPSNLTWLHEFYRPFSSSSSSALPTASSSLTSHGRLWSSPPRDRAKVANQSINH